MSDYEQYLEKYCKSYGVTKEEAESHYLVQEVKHYYNEKEGKKNAE